MCGECVMKYCNISRVIREFILNVIVFLQFKLFFRVNPMCYMHVAMINMFHACPFSLCTQCSTEKWNRQVLFTELTLEVT